MALRNYIHRRNHKERGQLSHRKKLGLLEKHKDYVQRAKDHHSKRDRIKRLKEKALDRNKDEFYFGMIKSKVEKGVHIKSRGNEALSSSLVSLLKTQDAAYVRRQMTAERKRIEALVAQLAPSVASMRVEWLEEKPSRLAALREAGLLAERSAGGKGKGKGKMVLRDDVGDGRVGSQGKKTVWLDGVDEVRKYAPPTAAAADPSSSSSSHRSIEDYDLDDLDEDVLVNEGELSDSDSEADASDSGDDSDPDDAPAPSSSFPRRRSGTSASSPPSSSAAPSRAAEKHWSYLLSLLRARQARLAALSSAASRLGVVRSLMSSRGASVSKRSSRSEEQRLRLVDAVARGKMTANGLALPGNEEEDDGDGSEGEEVNGTRSGKAKVTFKWGKERKR